MELDPTHLAALAGWIYVIVFAVAALDAIIPVMPSESVVVTAAVLAARGDVSLPLVLLAAAAGAMSGDAFSYLLGVRLRNRRARLGLDGELGGRSGKAVRWAAGMLERRSYGTLIVSRFIPGGRTATTFTAGFTSMRPRTFLTGIGAGAVLWAGQAGLIGFAGGHVFGDNLLLGIAIGVASGMAVGLGIELVRSRLSTPTVDPATATPAVAGSTGAPTAAGALFAEGEGAEIVAFPTPAPEPAPIAA